MKTTASPSQDMYGCVALRGAQALQMLHGQCTQAVKGLSDAHAPLAGFCSTKGRLIAAGRIWATTDGACILTCTDVIERLIHHLTPFARLARVELQPDPRPVSLKCSEVSAPAGQLTRNHDQLTITEHGQTHWVLGAETGLETTALRDQIEAGFTFVHDAVSDRFLPQQLHYPLLQGVSFQKGCYTGQEVVARLEHLGRVKRYAQRYDSPVTLEIGQEVNIADWTGEVVQTVQLAEQSRALVVIDATAHSEQLRGVPFPVEPVIPRQRP